MSNSEAPPRTQAPQAEEPLDSADAYCRAIEAYLCRKNDGHLIRIVGPAFEKVQGWVRQGVPLKVACRGMDRYFERYYAKGPRRRPVRVEFCEADVLDAFDEWRRAVGVAGSADAGGADPAEHGSATAHRAGGRRHGSLAAHLDRAIARLTALRAGDDRTLDDVLEALVRELDAARADAAGLRGAARAALVARLADLDARLMTAVRARLTTAQQEALRREAEAELAPFRARMPPAAFVAAVDACMDRALRDAQRIPTLTFE